MLAPAESILDTICSVLEAESACVALTDFPEKVYFWSGRGICEPGTYAAWAKSFVATSLTAANNTVTIIEDAAEDARSAHAGCWAAGRQQHLGWEWRACAESAALSRLAADCRVKSCPYVKGEEAIRSCVAAPLVATNGIRVGAL